MLSQGRTFAGVELAIGSMTLGQRCQIEVDAPFHYGEAGWQPMVADGATLVYDIELLAFDDPEVQ